LKRDGIAPPREVFAGVVNGNAEYTVLSWGETDYILEIKDYYDKCFDV